MRQPFVLLLWDHIKPQDSQNWIEMQNTNQSKPSYGPEGRLDRTLLPELDLILWDYQPRYIDQKFSQRKPFALAEG